jgi:hypothetical protein
MPHIGAIVLAVAATAGCVMLIKKLVWDPHLKLWIELHFERPLEQPYAASERTEMKQEEKWRPPASQASWHDAPSGYELRQRRRPAPPVRLFNACYALLTSGQGRAID